MHQRQILTSLVFTSMLLCTAGWAHAQQPAGSRPVVGAVAASPDVVKIRRVIGAGPRLLVDTPKYQTGTSAGVKPIQRWAQIQVQYETTAEWTDELVFQYYVMSRKMNAGKPVFSLFKTIVRYVDVKRGSDHVSTVFMRPAALDRYGQIIASAVEISAGGQVVAEDDHTDGSVKLPEKWWRQANVVESKDVAIREGYLLDRAHSPFALINIDDYETIRP